MAWRFRPAILVALAVAMVVAGCASATGIPAVTLGSEQVSISDSDNSNGGTTDADGSAGGGSSLKTINGQLVLPNGEVITEAPAFVAGSSAQSEDPAGIVAAMATDLPFRVPPGTNVSSISVVTETDQSEGLLVSINVRVTGEMTSDQLRQLITAYPVFPRNLQLLPLPAGGNYNGWQQEISMSYNPDAVPVRSLAEVSLRTSGTANVDGQEPIGSTELSAPVGELISVFAPAVANRSELTWRPSEPNVIEAMVWLEHTIEDRLLVARTIGEQAVPASVVVEGVWIEATMTTGTGAGAGAEQGQGGNEAQVRWRPGGESNDLLRLVCHYSIQDGKPAPDASLAPPQQPGRSTVVDWEADWYIDEDGRVDSGWNTVDFDPSFWRVAPAPFHRREDERLPGSTVNTPSSGMTTWLRRTFDVDDPAALETLMVESLADDGVVIWINGVELHRWNMPDGQVRSGSHAVDRIFGLNELLVRRATDLPTSALVPGENVIAVAVHQASADSNDIRFDLRLSATTN